MGKMRDLTNQRFGKLIVVSNAGKLDGRHYYWNCICDCGRTLIRTNHGLTSSSMCDFCRAEAVLQGQKKAN